MVNNMLKLNKKMVQNRNYYHTCPACRINIFNADFRIFLYNRAGNKTDETFFFFLRAPNVLTEARVSGLRASVLRTLDRQICLFFLPQLSLASRPTGTPESLSSALLFLGRTELWAAKRRPWHSKFSEPEVSRGPRRLLGICLAAFQPEEKSLRDLPPARVSLTLPKSRGAAPARAALF